MRLLKYEEDGRLTINSFDDNATPPYAILSHTWGDDAEEVTFADLGKGDSRHMAGYKKILFCGQQAQQDGLQYFWVDTCCIDKTDKAELDLAIRSMFRWYQDAMKCYVYLSDVSTKIKFDDMPTQSTWESAFRSSRWFTRGWTLQELLAPKVVEFFSQEWEKLGEKSSLKPLIKKITGIPCEALDGAPLSRFSVDERLRWKGDRVTKHEEDAWYSLSGIFDVEIAPAYSEGAASAFKRLKDEIDKLEICVRDIRYTDPRHDKKRIEDTKGGLLAASYRWVLDNTTFQQWRQDPHSRLLWVKGDPGKGKTMLLCGIINELHSSLPKNALLSYFFCQATDSRINNATAVLRGLLYMLVSQQTSLVSHIRKRHDHAGKALFEDANAWVALTEIFADVLQDPQLRATYLVIDALDECVTDLPKLLYFIAKQSSVSSRVKWIMSSRNWPEIEEQLERAGHKVRLSLELDAKSEATTAHAVFIQQKVNQLAQKGQYEAEIEHAVLQHLMSNANGTFLWVTLACQDLASTPKSNVLEKLASFPPGLDPLYKRMLRQIIVSDGAGICRRVLALTAILYRPVTIPELVSLVEPLESFVNDPGFVREIISLCGSFLTLREDTIYFVHQSAKDFISATAFDEVFPDGIQAVHRVIFSRSLATLSRTLHRDMYNLEGPGYPSDDIKPPNPDPLASSRYPCVHWIDHLFESTLEFQANSASDRQAIDLVDKFLRKKYLYWLEGLSLCRSMAKGIVSMSKLCSLVQTWHSQDILDTDKLTRLVQDARRFFTYYKRAIESSPLQAYASALLFSPTRSLVREMFQHEEPKWITVKPTIGDSWGACLQTLEGHSDVVSCVTFLLDGKRLASMSWDNTIKIWDVESGELQATVKGHRGLMDFSRDGKRLASYNDDGNFRLWDSESGAAIMVLESHSEKSPMGHGRREFPMAFSHDSKLLVSGSEDNKVRLWNAESGAAVRTLEGDGLTVLSVTFSPDGKRLAAGLDYGIVKLWNVDSGTAIPTLRNHSIGVCSVVFSPDSKQLASSSLDHTVRIWDAESCDSPATLNSHNSSVHSIAFSSNREWLASGSGDCTISLRDGKSGAIIATLEGHSECVTSLAFSPNSKRLASGSEDRTVRLWDVESRAEVERFDDYSEYNSATAIAFSPDGKQLVLGSGDCYVRLVSAEYGEVGKLHATLGSNNSAVTSFASSSDGKRLVTGSEHGIFNLWDLKPSVLPARFSLRAPIFRQNFSAAGTYVNSNTGIIRLNSDMQLTHEQCDLFVAGEWVMLGSQRLFWLPPDYRATCSAVNGWNMVLGHSSGRMSYLHFDFSAAGLQNRFFHELDHPAQFTLVI